MMKLALKSWTCVIAAVFLSIASFGQDFRFNIDVELVQLSVSVNDKQGRLVDDLKKEDFRVFEDGVEQQISLFQHEDIPISLGLVIDNSGSMRNKRERVNGAALAFARESHPADETFIVNFDNDAYLEQDFTSNMEDLIKTLDHLDTQGETALYDAVYLSLDHIRSGKKDKKALLLISDGEDNNSKYDFKKVVDRLRQSRVTLYAIGLLEENTQGGGGFHRSSSRKAKDALRKFAEVSGGQAYFPKSLNEVEGLCRRIARDLRNHYTLGYSPLKLKSDGSWREIEVRLNPKRPNLIVRTKPGYYGSTDKRTGR